MILAIDTSTDTASVAVLGDQEPLSEITWASRGTHSRRIIQLTSEALSLAGIVPSELSAIAVAIGPGSFNGLRVGLSAAKGMAMALSIPLVGISTLDVIGFQAAAAGRRVVATVPAGRHEICISVFTTVDDALKRETDYLRLGTEEAANLCSAGDIIAGPGREALAESLALRGCPVTVQTPVRDSRRGSYLAELGRRYVDAGGESQMEDIVPLYLRRSAAEEKRAAEAQE